MYTMCPNNNPQGHDAMTFDEALHLSFFRNAQFFAADLFYESFAVPFPIPRENAGLSIPTPPDNWWLEVHFAAIVPFYSSIPMPAAHFPGSSRFWLVALLMAAYAAGYAWSSPTTDTADELLKAYGIRHALAYPIEGPFLGGALHFGPLW